MASKSIVVRDFHKEVPGSISHDKRMWLFPQVNSINSHGKKTEWRIAVRVFIMNPSIVLPNVPETAFAPFDPSYLDNLPLPDNIRGWIKVDSRIGDGEIRTSVPTIVHKGKNMETAAGKVKKNATNVVCQTLRDAYSLHNKQVKKSIHNVAEGGETKRYPPMLAQILSEQVNKPDYTDKASPVYLQRKYNGVRTVSTLDYAQINGVRTPVVIMYSRRGNLYPGFDYIKKELYPIFQLYAEEGRKLYLDGEIYKHGVALQDISGQSRRESEPNDVKYNYMIYDCFDEKDLTMTYSERRDILNEIFENFELQYAKPVETFHVASEEEVTRLSKQFIDEDFEGAMLRLDRPYAFSYNEKHSKVLLKIKPRYDKEYAISGWTIGEKGKAAGALMIKCKTQDFIGEDGTIVAGKEFPVTPAMEIPDRIALAKKMATVDPTDKSGPDETPVKTYFETQYLMRPLIVYYDEVSNDGVPQRASTKMEIRTWE